MGAIAGRDLKRVNRTRHVAGGKDHEVLAPDLIGDRAYRIGIVLLGAPERRPPSLSSHALHIGFSVIVRVHALAFHVTIILTASRACSSIFPCVLRDVGFSDRVVGDSVEPGVFQADHKNRGMHLLGHANYTHQLTFHRGVRPDPKPWTV